MIRKATEADLVRIAEIAVFVKRMNYRRIFCDDDFSFNKLTVVDTIKTQRDCLDDLWVYESDHIVKAYIQTGDAVNCLLAASALGKVNRTAGAVCFHFSNLFSNF